MFSLNARISEQEAQMATMQETFEKRMQEERAERERMVRDALERDRAHKQELKDKDEAFVVQLKEERRKVEDVTAELKEVQKSRDDLYEAKFDFGTVVDGKDKEI